KITVQRELQSARIGGAVHRGDHGDRAIAHRAEHALEGLVLLTPLLVAERVALLQVRAGAKRLVALTGEDQAAVPLFGLERLEKFAELERRPGIEGVGDLGAGERREQNAVRLLLHPQRGVLGHAGGGIRRGLLRRLDSVLADRYAAGRDLPVGSDLRAD